MLTIKDLPNILKRAYAVTLKNQGQIIHTSQILRQDREFLVRLGWLEEITKGWYMLIKPGISKGESSAWYGNFWDFVRLYLQKLYGNDYCLSAESSIDLHLDHPSIPKQVVIICAKGGGQTLQLPYQTSLLVYRDPNRIPSHIEKVKGLRVMPLAYAICTVTPTFFEKSPKEAEIALRLIRDPSDILETIIENHIQKQAARLIGAYHFLGEKLLANTIDSSLKNVGLSLVPENPFLTSSPKINQPIRSPYVARIFAMWEEYREGVIKHFPKAPGLPSDPKNYIQQVQEVHKTDAYHSLSIEGYNVDEELIEKVENNSWNPDQFVKDAQERDALAARGYYEAFLIVKESLLKVLNGSNPGKIVNQDLPIWFQNLFNPMVVAGILKTTDVLGFRKNQVYIRGSRHVPLPREALLDAMETLFNCLEKEPHPAVRAVLGHFIFVFIHPYMDGNGRIGRYLMNVMMASGGYPWTIIQVKNRDAYFKSLEAASVDENIVPLTQFIASELIQSPDH